MRQAKKCFQKKYAFQNEMRPQEKTAKICVPQRNEAHKNLVSLSRFWENLIQDKHVVTLKINPL